MPTNHKSLTISDVIALGETLVALGNQYPLTYRTERDFFPLVMAYLRGRVPTLKPEAQVEDGRVDFRVGGTNPAYLELAVAPRALQDPDFPALVIPGHGAPTQLYASQNTTELQKLRAIPQSKAKNRYLLLIDFRAGRKRSAVKAQ